MSTLVLKFGGTSVASIELIKSAAQIIKKEYDNGHNIAVVVSAMAGTTNNLINYVNNFNNSNYGSDIFDTEYDVVVSSGEQIASGLMSLALNEIGVSAISWLGWQLPILTSGPNRNANISKIIPDKINACFKENKVSVLAGFQGLSSKSRITTIGRGGSDNTAVFLASALDADRCDIYTDVEGVYTSDPKMTDKVRKLDKISYEEMIEMASQGAKVLQTSSVESAINENVNIQVRSTFSPNQDGTKISFDLMKIKQKL
jgi:aspartate kinase